MAISPPHDFRDGFYGSASASIGTVVIVAVFAGFRSMFGLRRTEPITG